MSDDPDCGVEAIPHDRAVLDRIVDGSTAVLLVGAAGHELTLPADRLPEDASDGTWLVLDVDVDPPVVVAIDEELTELRRRDLSSRLSRVRQERRGGRFDADGGP